VHDGKKVLNYEAQGGSEEYLKIVLGKEFVAKMISIKANDRGISVMGFVGDPVINRPNRTNQYFFINRRPIRSIGLSSALRAAYGTLLPPGRFPMGVIFLELNPAVIDINVHPTKEEIRLQDANVVQGVVIRATREGIYKKAR